MGRFIAIRRAPSAVNQHDRVLVARFEHLRLCDAASRAVIAGSRGRHDRGEKDHAEAHAGTHSARVKKIWKATRSTRNRTFTHTPIIFERVKKVA
jgi:hypothetical protein